MKGKTMKNSSCSYVGYVLIICMASIVISCCYEDDTSIENEDSILPSIQSGKVIVCGNNQEEEDITFDGVITSVQDDMDSSCNYLFTVENMEGVQRTFGYSIQNDVRDTVSQVITLSNYISIGDKISVLYRYSMPFGSKSGLIVSDAEGVILAVDDGAYDGALNNDDIPGLIIQKDQDIVAQTDGPCIPKLGHSITFIGDEPVQLTPVSSGNLMIMDLPYTVMAIEATSPGTSNSCFESDTISYRSWALFRSIE